MIPASFEYAVARDLDHAIQLLASSGGEGKVLAGGQSLIPLMKFRLAQPSFLVDVNRIAGLAQIRENGDLRIGALVREADLDQNPIVRERYQILVDTTRVIADPLVRNLATVGGNLAHADPANDHPATMLAVRASVVARGRNGERVIPIDDFFVDTFTTVLSPDEILTEIRIPKPPPRSGGAYLKLERKVGDFAIAGVAAMIALDEKGKGAAARLGMTGTHIGCDTTNCGACTVLLNGRAVKSCTLFAVQADQANVTTVEGLEKDGKLHPIQEGFHQEHGLQCGFCTPGMMMTAVAFLATNPKPTELQIREAISGNLCRCTGYVNIVKSIDHAARAMRETAEGKA